MKKPADVSPDAWTTRAGRVMPGLNSNFRPGAGTEPLVFEHADGVRCYAPDGRDYIDYVLGMGPAIWGHSHTEYREAIHEQLDRLFSCGSAVAHTTLEIELAEKIVAHVPCAEKVRFGISGSEAVQVAIRLARASTGKPYILRFEGHYHGWLDPVFCGEAAPETDDLPFPQPSATDSGGLPQHVYHDTLMIPWNDSDRLERVLEQFGADIALVLMEPVMCNNACCPPRSGYLESARELCDRFGILLCFDEVITGFRMGIGGAQEHFGVTPDLAIFAKAMAGGLPLSVLAGKSNVMNELQTGTALGGGTFNTFPLAMAGALATIRMLTRDNGQYYDRVDQRQALLQEGFREIAKKYDQPVLIQGPRGLIYVGLIDKDIAHTPADLASIDVKKQLRFRTLLHEQGVIIGAGSRWVISGELSDEDISDTLERTDRAMAQLN